MKPVTLKWIDKYKNAEHRPATPDVLYTEVVADDSDLESEKSYQGLTTASEVFETYVFLYQNAGFMFLTTCANIVLFFINTYTYAFLEQYRNESAIIVFIQFVCYLIIILEIFSSVLHHICKKIAAQRALTPRHWIIIVTDFTLQCTVTIIGLTISWDRTFLSFFETFRLFRVFVFYGLISSSPGKHTFMFSLLKSSMVVFVVSHIAAVTAQIFQIETSDSYEMSWRRTFVEMFNRPINESTYVYTFTAFVVFSALSNMGVVVPSYRNSLEQALAIFLMLFGMIYINGIFLGNYTSLRLNMYQIKTIYYNKLKLVNKNLLDYKVPKKIRNKIKNYYLEFWNNEAAIISSKLINELPMSIQHAIYLDKYWFTFENSNILPRTHYGFKRALAYVMETRIYSTGETVYLSNTPKDTLIYIHRGTVQVLSAEDMESPLITLSVGTIIGETSLLVSYSSPLQIIASTYCVAYCISKMRFWYIVNKYRKLQQSQIVQEHFREIFDLAQSRKIQAKTMEKTRSLMSLEGLLANAISNQKEGAPKLLYVLSKQFGKRNRIDEIFLHTKFPWILNSKSRLIFYWELIVVVFTFIIAITLPYVIAFRLNSNYYFHILEYYMNALFILDVVLYLFVAIEDESGLRSTVVEILMVRVHSVFILDIIAAIPVRYLLDVVEMDVTNSRTLQPLPMIRLVKFHKIVGFISKIENSFKFDLALLRLIKYQIYLAFCAYLMTALFYINACDEAGFAETSWASIWLEKEPELTDIHIFMNTFKSAFEVVLLAGAGILGFKDITDLVFLIVFICVGILMFTYIAADYSATLTLNAYELGTYSKTMQTIQQLSLNPLFQTSESKRNLDRIYDYLSSQWYFNRGTKIKELLSDGPETLYELQQVAKYSNILQRIPIFESFGKTFCNKLATYCEEVQFAPFTIFINESEISEYMYIIDKGYCQLVDGASKRIEKTLGPGANLCILETMLGIYNLFFARSITSIALFRISKKHLQSALRNVRGIEGECLNFRTEMKNTLMYSHFKKGHIRMLIYEDDSQRMPSFFVFPNDKTDPLYQDFLYGWTRFGIFRYVMLPITIMPEGAFIIGWEILYNILTFALVTVALTFDYWSAVSLKYSVIMRALEAYQLIAIYVRFHVCYYDKKGILISHPKLTGYHYLVGAFLVDIAGVMPITVIYHLVVRSARGFSGCYNFNKLLLMYRLPTAFYYFKRDVLKPRGIALNVFFFTPITITFLLSVTCVIISSGSEIIIADNKQVYTALNDTILGLLSQLEEYLFDTREPLGMYLITLYFCSANAMQLGCHPIIMKRVFEVIATIMILLAGYMIFTYILVIIANSQTIINSALTLYQSHMKHTIKFMKMEHVPKQVQRDAIHFYEYSWQQMHGLDINDVLSRCHTVLREDFLYDQYKNTFDKVSIFQFLDSTIYRELSLRLTRVYMLPNVEFIKLNDIVSHLYIVHSGRINVYGPNGKLFQKLQCGSLFGCLDNVSHVRSMVSFVSIGSVDLLEIEAKLFYKLMIGLVLSELEKSMLVSNMSFVPGRDIKIAQENFELIEGLVLKESWKSKILNALGMNMAFLIITFASVIVISYVATFYMEAMFVYLLVYTFDLLHLIMIIIQMFTPYYDAKGQLITDHKLIRRRYVRLPVFYWNLLAIIPIDAIFLIDMGIEYQFHIYRALLLTRLLRIYNITSFFNKFNDILNSDLLIMKLMSIIVYTTLLLHFETCILFTISALGTLNFAEGLWAYQPTEDGEMLMCGNPYICAFYFATSTLTFSGFSIYPRSVAGVGLYVFFVVFSKFIMSIFVAKLSACIQNYGADLARFDQIFTEMKNFLSRSAVSEYLITCIVYYCEQLWIRSKGVQEPYLLMHAPSYLKEQIKIAAFGKHIYDNPLFADTHRDFLRHVIRMIDIQIFFKNDIICEQGDINETMYFIHSGTIDVIFSTDEEDVKVDELRELDCFGIIQGLYARTPHTHKFKASSVTVLCTLSLKDWIHILDFYPASKFEIYETLYSMPP